MEERYRQHFVASTFHRMGPVMVYFWLPVLIVMRFLWIIYWLLFPFKVTPIECVVGAMRCSYLIFGITIVTRKWDASAHAHIGQYTLWISRTAACVAAVQQAVAKENDPQILSGLVSFTCFCGMAIPSFTEYLCAALLLPYIQPIRLFFSGDNFEHIQEILFQHTLIFALGLSITWTVHADCRRDWLRFPTSFDHKSALFVAAHVQNCRAAPENEEVLVSGDKATPGTVQDIIWDHLEDGYFTDADLHEMRADMMRVSAACLRLLATMLVTREYIPSPTLA